MSTVRSALLCGLLVAFAAGCGAGGGDDGRAKNPDGSPQVGGSGPGWKVDPKGRTRPTMDEAPSRD
jgi:hypothetical protein